MSATMQTGGTVMVVAGVKVVIMIFRCTSSVVKDVRCWSAIAVGATGSRFSNDGRTVEDTRI